MILKWLKHRRFKHNAVKQLRKEKALLPLGKVEGVVETKDGIKVQGHMHVWHWEPAIPEMGLTGCWACSLCNDTRKSLVDG